MKAEFFNKPIIPLVASALLICMAFATETPVQIDEAVKKKLISVSIFTNTEGTHYHEPIEATLYNLTNKNVEISIPAGFIFQPQDTLVQKQMNLKTEIITLKWGEQKKLKITSNCIQAENGCAKTKYTLGGMASAALLQLAQFIEKRKYWNLSAQSALWCVSDGYGLEEINSYDTACDIALQKEVALLLGKKIPARPKAMDYRHNYYAPSSAIKSKIGGGYSISLHKAKDVILGMYNTRGIIVREMYNQKAVPPGPHEIKFEFDGTEYTDKSYVFKLIIDGKVMLEDEMEFSNVE